MIETNVKISNLVYEIRKKAGMTQDEFGKLFNVSKGAVSNWERSKGEPRGETMRDMIALLKDEAPEECWQLDVIATKKINASVDQKNARRKQRRQIVLGEQRNSEYEAYLNKIWIERLPSAFQILHEHLGQVFGGLLTGIQFQHVDEAGYWFTFRLINDDREQTYVVRHEETRP